ncbi:MAG TPA: immunoglobulin domain-containing protein [Methylomirabilota bacterium]|nr:immunoglobulin domain-containing protein [Methylomirabilota bacterium]
MTLRSDGTFDLQWDGTNVFQRLPTPFRSMTGGRFGLAARTGNTPANHWIDDLCVSVYREGPVVLTRPPAPQTVREGRGFVFHAGIDGSPPYFVQWATNGVAVEGAASLCYTGLASRWLDGTEVTVTVRNEFSAVTSPAVRLTVEADTHGPVVVSAKANRAGDQVTLTFDEPVEPGLALDPFNYSIEGERPADVTLAADGQAVLLSLAGPLPAGGSAGIEIHGLTDLLGNAIDGGITNVPIRVHVITPGFVQIEIYQGIRNATVNDLTASPKYPDSPDLSFYSHLADWAQPRSGHPARPIEEPWNHYGLRLSGFFVPRASGDHRFYFVNDDQARFRFSRDANPANAVTLLTPPCCRNYPFVEDAARSVVVPDLVAGRHYYFETLLKEGTGPDYLGMGVREPDDSCRSEGLPPIRNFLLATLADPDAAPALSFTAQPADATVLAGERATFHAATAFSGNALPFYQWQVDGADIPGAHDPSYTTPVLTLADHGRVYRVVAHLPGTNVTSVGATLTVLPNTNAPTLTAAMHNGLRLISVAFDEPVVVAGGSESDPAHWRVNDGAAVVESVRFRADRQSALLLLATAANEAVTVRASTNFMDRDGHPVAEDPSQPGFGWPLLATLPTTAWTDVGDPSRAGMVFTVDEQEIEITSGGQGLGSGGDRFTYLHRRVTNDFDVCVRVDRFEAAPDVPARAGLNVRESLDGSATNASRMVWVGVASGGGAAQFEALLRPSPADDVVDFNRSVLGAAHPRWGGGADPVWLRIKRVGRSFTCYNSFDGRNWNPIGEPELAMALDFPDGLWIGVGVASGTAEATASALFSHFMDWRYEGASVSVLQHPQDAAAPVGGTVTLIAGGQVEGAPAHELAFQWQRNGGDIPGANQRTFTTPPLTRDDDGAQYRAVLRVSGAAPAFTASATVRVLSNGDITPPLLATARRHSLDPGRVILTFSEPLLPSSVEALTNYRLNYGATVLAARLISPTKIALTTTPLSNCVPYQVIVWGVRDASGNPMSRSATAIPEAGAPVALFVAGRSAAMNASDLVVSNRIAANGFEVMPVSGPVVARRGAAAAQGASIVVISSTVTAADIGTHFRDLPAGILNWESQLQDDFDFTGPVIHADLGTTNHQTEINLVGVDHPLAAGLAAGPQPVTSDPRTYGWGVPGGDVSLIAVQAGNPARALIYAYELGATLRSGTRTAAGRRVQTFLDNDTAATLSPAGLALLDAALQWIAQPVLVGQPEPAVAPAGSDVNFCVAAASPTPVTYQWLKDGVPLSGANAPVLRLQGVQREDAGDYTVQILNGTGITVRSTAAALDVVVPPSILRGPVGQTNRAGANVRFSVMADGRLLTYQWYKDGWPLPGANSAELELLDLNPSQMGSYSVTVSNLAGQVSSEAAPLRVWVAGRILDHGYEGGTGRFHLTFETVKGLTYTLEWTPRLGERVFWMPVQTVAGDGTPLRLEVPAGTQDNRFYRLRVD